MYKYVTIDEYRAIRKNIYTNEHPHILAKYEGLYLDADVCERMDELRSFEVRADDCWVITYPKAGTTWVQEIAFCAVREGNLEEVNKIHTKLGVPFLEQTMPEEIRRLKNLPPTHRIADEMPSPRVIKTHLPGHFLPPELWDKGKIIYVIRDPKDLMVSYFHFENMLNMKGAGLPWDEYLEYRNSEQANYGSWWDHYLYFWKRRHQPNLLVLRFEDLKRDLRGNVERICRFLGKDLSAETLDGITDHCTFANMKKNPMTNPDYLLGTDVRSPDDSFMRKGKTGNWKTYFTVAQNEAMDALIKEKLHGTGLTFDY